MNKMIKYIVLINILALNIANTFNASDAEKAKIGVLDIEKIRAEVMEREKYKKAFKEAEELQKKYTIELEEKRKHVMREYLLYRIREFQSIYQ